MPLKLCLSGTLPTLFAWIEHIFNMFKVRNAVFYLKIITRDPSVYNMEHIDSIVLNFMDNTTGRKMATFSSQVMVNYE